MGRRGERGTRAGGSSSIATAWACWILAMDSLLSDLREYEGWGAAGEGEDAEVAILSPATRSPYTSRAPSRAPSRRFSALSSQDGGSAKDVTPTKGILRKESSSDVSLSFAPEVRPHQGAAGDGAAFQPLSAADGFSARPLAGQWSALIGGSAGDVMSSTESLSRTPHRAAAPANDYARSPDRSSEPSAPPMESYTRSSNRSLARSLEGASAPAPSFPGRAPPLHQAASLSGSYDGAPHPASASASSLALPSKPTYPHRTLPLSASYSPAAASRAAAPSLAASMPSPGASPYSIASPYAAFPGGLGSAAPHSPFMQGPAAAAAALGAPAGASVPDAGAVPPPPPHPPSY